MYFVPEEILAKRPWLRQYDYDAPVTINYPRYPAFDMLLNTANYTPHRAATWFYGTEITFWELYLTTIRLANTLIDLGVKKGDRIGIFLPNCPQFVISYWALLATGAIVVNLNPLYTADELKSVVKMTGMSGLIAFDMVLPNVRAMLKDFEVPLVVVTRLFDFITGAGVSTKEDLGLEAEWYHFSELLARSTNTVRPRISIKPEDPALIQLTGGTTGVPKGATLTHHNLVTATHLVGLWGRSVTEKVPIERRVVLCTLPYFHVYGEICAMSYSIFTTSTQVILPRWEIEEVMNTIALFPEFSFWPCVPTMLQAVLHHPRAEELNLGVRFDFVNSGAAPCPVELIEKGKDMNIYMSEGWGMSETTSLGISNPVTNLKKVGSIGIPYPDVDIRIVDIQTGEDLPVGERGELVIKSPLVMKEYWNNPEETARQLNDGWLNTGDMAYIDEDGYVFIVDRTKDMIIAGGFNIYPQEIDDVIFKHPQVKDVITVGIPDEYRGETVKAFIQPVEGATVTEEEIIAFCREKLAAYKIPRIIEFRSELPRSTVGKAFRRVLRDEEIAKMKKGSE